MPTSVGEKGRDYSVDTLVTYQADHGTADKEIAILGLKVTLDRYDVTVEPFVGLYGYDFPFCRKRLINQNRAAEPKRHFQPQTRPQTAEVACDSAGQHR